MNRQYVGARYVPLLLGDWQQNRTYEQLSVVNYLGSSYTSKKPVPAGIEPTNTEYWVLTGNYNAQVEQYRQETVLLSEKTDMLEGKVDGLEKRVDNIVTNAGSKIVFFGDSWTVGTGAGDAGTSERETNKFSTRIAATLGLEQVNYGVGASGFCVPGNTFDSQISNADNEMLETDKSKVSHVLICGGINDLRHISDYNIEYSSFVQNIRTCVNHAHNVFKNAKIYIAIGNLTVDGVTSKWHEWIENAQRDVLYNIDFPLNVVCNSGSSISGSKTNYISDGLHPNSDGHSKFAAHICKAILGCGDSVSYSPCSVTFDSNIVEMGQGEKVRVWKENNFATIPDFYMSVKTPITTNTVIGTIPAEITPANNVYNPIYYGNKIVGSLAITAAGSLRVIPVDAAVSATFFFSGYRWIVESIVAHT